MWRERGIRSWGEGWWEMPVTVGDQIGRIIGAPPGSTVMHQNVTVAEEIVLSCFRDRRRAQPDRLRGGELPVGSLPLPGAAATSRSSRSKTTGRSSTRSTSGRCSCRSGTCSSRTRRSRTIEPIIRRAHEVRRARDARLLPVGGRRAVRRHRARRRLRLRRQRQVALRRARAPAGSTCAPTSPSGSSRRSSAGRATRGRSRSSRSSSTPRARARFLTGTPNVPALYAATAGYDVIEEVGVDRIRERSLALTQLLIDLLDERGLRGRLAARARAPRRHRARSHAGPRRRAQGARRARRSSATSGPTRASASARTSSTPRTSSAHGRPARPRSSTTGAYERHAGRSRPGSRLRSASGRTCRPATAAAAAPSSRSRTRPSPGSFGFHAPGIVDRGDEVRRHARAEHLDPIRAPVAGRAATAGPAATRRSSARTSNRRRPSGCGRRSTSPASTRPVCRVERVDVEAPSVAVLRRARSLDRVEAVHRHALVQSAARTGCAPGR